VAGPARLLSLGVVTDDVIQSVMSLHATHETSRQPSRGRAFKRFIWPETAPAEDGIEACRTPRGLTARRESGKVLAAGG
jgi:hypothetical protein